MIMYSPKLDDKSPVKFSTTPLASLAGLNNARKSIDTMRGVSGACVLKFSIFVIEFCQQPMRDIRIRHCGCTHGQHYVLRQHTVQN